MNYQLEMERIISETLKKGEVPKLLIHSCCGPCSSYVLEYLSKYFYITIYYYNPNIDTNEEFEKRFYEQERLLSLMNFDHRVNLIKGEYENIVFLKATVGLESLKEGGKRCFQCYELRMREAAKYALANNFDYFTTTLSVSPHKNSNKVNEIGEKLEKEFAIKYLYADFKKKNGYQRSIELSKEYNLYRQDYCGCIYSFNNRE